MASRRLTDDEIETVGRRFPTHFGEPVISVRIQEALSEIRERRASDLTDEEREALRWLRHDTDIGAGLCSLSNCESCNRHRLAVAALDKLIGEVR